MLTSFPANKPHPGFDARMGFCLSTDPGFPQLPLFDIAYDKVSSYQGGCHKNGCRFLCYDSLVYFSALPAVTGFGSA